MRTPLLLLACTCSILAPAAHAADNNLRPGLWEITTSSDLLWLAPQISAEDMQNLKDLAGQYGIEMPQVQMGEAVSRACITQEMADQRSLPDFYQTELGCSTQNATRNGSRYKLEFVCAGPDLTGKGTAEGSVTSPESFQGRTRFDGTARGVPVNEQAEVSGRWVDSNCETAQPL